MHDATLSRPLQDPGGLAAWHTPCVRDDPRVTALQRATNRHREAVRKAEAARLEHHRAIATALAAGLKQAQVVEVTGYTREHVRRIAMDTDPSGD